MKNFKEQAMRLVFLIAACTSVLAVVLICVFLFANGVPAIAEIGLFDFLLGKEWRPSNNIYGILPMILGSIYVTAGAILIGVPIALLTSVFMAKYCPKKIYPLFRSAINLMAGVPSIVYGFFGMVLIVPTIRNLFPEAYISGSSMLAASVLLGIMILPTIIGVTETSIRSVPDSYYEGSLALGATHERSVYCIVFPAAKSGIMAGIVLGIGRAIGETMAVVMVAGNQAIIPEDITSGVRTLTANIVLEMAYATDLHKDALIATAAVLFVFVMIINVSFSLFKKKKR